MTLQTFYYVSKWRVLCSIFFYMYELVPRWLSFLFVSGIKFCSFFSMSLKFYTFNFLKSYKSFGSIYFFCRTEFNWQKFLNSCTHIQMNHKLLLFIYFYFYINKLSITLKSELQSLVKTLLIFFLVFFIDIFFIFLLLITVLSLNFSMYDVILYFKHNFGV